MPHIFKLKYWLVIFQNVKWFIEFKKAIKAENFWKKSICFHLLQIFLLFDKNQSNVFIPCRYLKLLVCIIFHSDKNKSCYFVYDKTKVNKNIKFHYFSLSKIKKSLHAKFTWYKNDEKHYGKGKRANGFYLKRVDHWRKISSMKRWNEGESCRVFAFPLCKKF